jgi:hypothetical protein
VGKITFDFAMWKKLKLRIEQNYLRRETRGIPGGSCVIHLIIFLDDPLAFEESMYNRNHSNLEHILSNEQ